MSTTSQAITSAASYPPAPSSGALAFRWRGPTTRLFDDAALPLLARERSRLIDAIEAAERSFAVAGATHAAEIGELRHVAAARHAVWSIH